MQKLANFMGQRTDFQESSLMKIQFLISYHIITHSVC